jgi:hypothetical protein
MGVDVRVVEWLRGQGHEAIHLREEGLHRAPDEQVFAKALAGPRWKRYIRSGWEGGEVTLLVFLSFTAGVCGLAGALGAGKNEGLLGILTGLIIGAGTGLGAFLIAYRGGGFLIDRLGLDGSKPSAVHSALSYLIVAVIIMLWPLSIFLAGYLTRKALAVMLSVRF